MLLVGAGVIARRRVATRCAGSPSTASHPGRRHAARPRRACRDDHPLFLGMVGMHAARYTNLVLEECDLLIGLGVRFDDRATGKASEFCPRAQIVHVDIDPSELGKIKQPTARHRRRRRRRRCARCEPLRRAGRRARHGARAWRRCAPRIRSRCPAPTIRCEPYGIVRHAAALRRRRRHRHHRRRPAPDVGRAGVSRSRARASGSPRAASARWASACRPRSAPRSRCPIARSCASRGDGSLLMNLQELATAAEEERRTSRSILLNNAHLGLVRQQQQLFYGGRYHASRFHAEPDFAAIARGFGIAALRPRRDRATRSPRWRARSASRARAWSTCRSHADANVYPMVPPGAPTAT